MTLDDAKKIAKVPWLATSERAMGCQMEFDDSRAERHTWGWVLCLIPAAGTECRHEYKEVYLAVDNELRFATPVGTKGLEEV